MVNGAAGSGSNPRYFSEDEVRGLDPRLVALLDHARGLAKIPFRITSGCRTPLDNQTVRGVMDSSHTRGLAVDIAWFDSRARMRMAAALLLAGFKRIGLYAHHVHADID